MNRAWKTTAAFGALLGALALGGCQSAAQRFGEVAMINGQVPQGRLAPMVGVTTMIDTVDADGKRLVVTKGVRKAGTRAGIHVHEHGGHTCVMSGEITDFVEGKPDSRWPAGTCYYMPPNTPMAAANLGKTDAILVDTFVLPPGRPTMTVLEPGYKP